MGFKGFNCTIPHKVNVIQFLDKLGKSASLMGAVNCVVNKNGQLIGENTDGKGFVRSLEEITNPKGKKVVIFGAGGAARAISVEVALAGAKHITIVNRSRERGEELTTLLQDNLPCYADFNIWDSTYSPDGVRDNQCNFAVYIQTLMPKLIMRRIHYFQIWLWQMLFLTRQTNLFVMPVILDAK